MRLALKMAGGILFALVLVVGAAVLWLFHAAARPENPVGFDEVVIRDPQDKPLDAGIWYPTNSPSLPVVLGLSAQRVAPNGTVARSGLPLIVISHGNNGLFSSHADTALALASAGFVVAAVTHTGDNARDPSYIGTPRWLIDRSRHIHLLIDYMLGSWRAHRRLDASKVGMFGFSAGGFTALVAIGGVPDYARLAEHCRTQPEFACALWSTLPAPVPATSWTHDFRIRAAAIAAPGYGFAFDPNGLSSVKTAVQLWNGDSDHIVPYETNEALVRKRLPVPPEYHVVAGAGHYAFVAPCAAWLFPMICKDRQGFDRIAFHRDLNRSLIAFFRSRLDGNVTARE